MPSIQLQSPTDFLGWRNAARSLLQEGVAPENVEWLDANQSGSLFAEAAQPRTPYSSPTFTAPKAFVKLAAVVALHSDRARFALLYRLLWRLRTAPNLLQLSVDPDVARAQAMEKSVRRDVHKMHAFVRFRKIATEGDAAHYVAWFEPQHHTLEAGARFFVRRFPNFCWSILTPERSAHWDLSRLTFGPGSHRREAPAEDAREDLWRTYYASIFNPARLKTAAMQAHMPKKYWRNLPESEVIPKLIAAAEERTRLMIQKSPTETPRIKARPSAAKPRHTPAPVGSLEEVREHAASCRDCPLWKNATQTVFGEGRQTAKVLFVGEQPGDQEDLVGRPFVGPAGRLLDQALAEAGVDRKSTYVTNAVKHFKFEPRGKRRIHKKPNEMEIAACHQWLERELRLINPDVVVALGATAARAVFGRATAIGRNRGRIIPADEAQTFTNADILVTVHPSYLLRVPEGDKDAAYAEFVADLRLIRKYA